jgi:hypothetical protein
MTIAASGASVVTTARGSTRGLPAATIVLGGTLLSLVGLTWDVQWHTDVGPDTFFTLPHLFLYSGSAVSGLTSLIVVLATTAATRRGRDVDTRVGGRAVGVFKTFNAPAGYLVSGIGAAAFLLYGLWDQWWHGLYGFDAVINSPPHIGLLLSVSVTMIGTVMVFAAARHERWGLIGALAGLGVLLAFSMVTVIGLQNLDGGVLDPIIVGSAFLSVLLVMIGAGLRGRPGGALGVAVTLAVIQGVFWWFSPWATRAYADMVGLPMRDYASTVPQMPSLMPMCLIFVAALLELALWSARSRNRPIGAVSLIAGALSGLLVALCSPLQTAWVFSAKMPDSTTVIATTAAGAVLGALAGFLGQRFGESLRLLAPNTEGGQHA